MQSELDHDDDWQLNTPAGILHLNNGHLMPHARDRLLTRLTGAAPLPGAQCPRWMQFLTEVTGGDKQLEAYLQRVAGYCLTGLVKEHAIFFLFGKSRTGKSVFLAIMTALLGDYAITAAMEMFLAADGMRHLTEVMDLKGPRLVISAETPEGRRWDDARLKQVADGSALRANWMRENTEQFNPKCKLLFAGNHRPRLRADDDAMRERFQVIPFRWRQRVLDKNLTDKLKGELDGIFGWAVQGVMQYKEHGLAPPGSVAEATNEYFLDEDLLGHWIADCCVTGPGETALTDILYRSFKTWWADKMGEQRCLALQTFSQRLQVRDGIERWFHPITRRRGFSGLALLVDQRDLPFAPRRRAPADPGDMK